MPCSAATGTAFKNSGGSSRAVAAKSEERPKGLGRPASALGHSGSCGEAIGLAASAVGPDGATVLVLEELARARIRMASASSTAFVMGGVYAQLQVCRLGRGT